MSSPSEMIASKMAAASGNAHDALQMAADYIEPHHDAEKAVDYLNYVLKETERRNDYEGMAALTDVIKELGGKPRPTISELRDKAKMVDQVSGGKSDLDYDRGAVYYKIVDPKSGNRVLHAIQSDTPEGIAKEIRQAQAEMKKKKKETAQRIAGERSANNS